MKNKSTKKTFQTMSFKAFEALAQRHIKNMCEEINRNGDQYLAQVIVKNPLSLVSVLGLTKSMGHEGLMLMTAATCSFNEMFKKFVNLSSDRYLTVLIFMDQYSDDLKTDPQLAVSLQKQSYKWIINSTDSINPWLKGELSATFEQLNARKEKVKLAQSVPISMTVAATAPTFKI